jgi:hypothetical protein
MFLLTSPTVSQAQPFQFREYLEANGYDTTQMGLHDESGLSSSDLEEKYKSEGAIVVEKEVA